MVKRLKKADHFLPMVISIYNCIGLDTCRQLTFNHHITTENPVKKKFSASVTFRLSEL